MKEGNFVALANNIQNEHETNKTCYKLIHLKRCAFPKMKVELKNQRYCQSPNTCK